MRRARWIVAVVAVAAVGACTGPGPTATGGAGAVGDGVVRDGVVRDDSVEASVVTAAFDAAAAQAAAEPEGVEAGGPDDDVTLTEVPVVLDEPAALTPRALSRQAVPPADDPQDAVDPEQATDLVAAPQDERLVTAPVDAQEYQTIGVTWSADDADAAVDVRVRTATDGRWSGWVALEGDDSAPDPGTADAEAGLRAGTDSLWIGDADAVQLSFAAGTPDAAQDVQLALVGSDPQDVTTAATTGGATVVPATMNSAPKIVTRATWGATKPSCTMDVASSLVGAVLHHTAGPNTYANQAQAMQQIRNDQRYHMQSRGWCDLGYNFVVDKWGNIYEGRAGSLSKPVIGVHAGGFNTGTVGVSMLGTYDSNPPKVTREAVAQIMAYRLGQYYVDPTSTMRYTTGNGENSRFHNETVTLPRIFGHRDVAYTACPGNGGYAVLPEIRERVRALIGGSLVSPSVSPKSPAAGATVTVKAATLGNLDWRLTVTDYRTGVVVRESIGYAQEAYGGVVATWDGRNAKGAVVGAGPYRVTLTVKERSSGATVKPYATTVNVTGSQNPPTVAPVALTGNLQLVPLAAPQRLLDTRPDAQSLGPRSRVDVKVAGVAGVPANAKAVVLNVTAVNSTGVTYVSAWPAGAARPGSSVLNVDSDRTAATGVMVGVGGEGKVSLYNNAGSTHLVADVTGYYVESGGAGYGALATPTRAYDSRTKDGPLKSGQTRQVQVAGKGGVPADARAVVLNVTSARSLGPGYVVAYPWGSTVPATSTVNQMPGKDVTNRTVVGLSGGKIGLSAQGAGSDVVVDVVGWFGPGGGSTFTPIAPSRMFDTRVSGGALKAGATRTLTAPSSFPVPADADAVAMVVTATKQTSYATYVTVWAGAGGVPGTSDLNTGKGRDQSNLVLSRWASPGAVRAYNDLGSTHLVGDVYGYFR